MIAFPLPPANGISIAVCFWENILFLLGPSVEKAPLPSPVPPEPAIKSPHKRAKPATKDPPPSPALPEPAIKSPHKRAKPATKDPPPSPAPPDKSPHKRAKPATPMPLSTGDGSQHFHPPLVRLPAPPAGVDMGALRAELHQALFQPLRPLGTLLADVTAVGVSERVQKRGMSVRLSNSSSLTVAVTAVLVTCLLAHNCSIALASFPAILSWVARSWDQAVIARFFKYPSLFAKRFFSSKPEEAEQLFPAEELGCRNLFHMKPAKKHSCRCATLATCPGLIALRYLLVRQSPWGDRDPLSCRLTVLSPQMEDPNVRGVPDSLRDLAAAWHELSVRLYSLVPAAGPPLPDAAPGAAHLPLPVGLLSVLMPAARDKLLDNLCAAATTDLSAAEKTRLWEVAALANKLVADIGPGWPSDPPTADDSSRQQQSDHEGGSPPRERPPTRTRPMQQSPRKGKKKGKKRAVSKTASKGGNSGGQKRNKKVGGTSEVVCIAHTHLSLSLSLGQPPCYMFSAD